MARRHRPDLEYIWRAIITHRWPNGEEKVEYSGPFTAKGYMRPSYYSGSATTETVIQRSKLNWETVETHKENND